MKLNEIVRSHWWNSILYELCDMIKHGQEKDSNHYGMVAACIVDPDGNTVRALNHANNNGHRTHAERATIEKYEQQYGEIPKGSIIITTLSPCSEHMHDREGASCTDLINSKGVKKVYCGYMDPTQSQERYQFSTKETNDKHIKDQCTAFANTFL